jgi:formamidopyrimidine-DNA glycosylase
MPEWPEMEHYRLMLEQRITGKRITGANVFRDKSVNLPAEHFIAELTGRLVTGVTRHAKHLVIMLDSGNGLLLHLMLGGWLFFGNRDELPSRDFQTQLDFGGQTLFFLGLRLGYLHLHQVREIGRLLRHLGPDPMDSGFTERDMAVILHARRGVLKPLLVNQNKIGGIGNCYSDEICYEAGILPQRVCSTIEYREVVSLHRAIRSVFREAAASGGYIEKPFFAGDRLTGTYRCRVYDRKGETCDRCGEPIRFETIASRKTFYCSGCQQ